MRPFSLILLLAACTSDPLPPTEDPPASVTVVAGEDLAVPVGTEIVLDGRGSSAGDATWNAGDGTSLKGLAVQHTYSEPGNYVAVLTVTGEGGLTRSASVRVTAYLAAAVPAPLSSTRLAIDPSRNQAWVPQPETDSITVVDLDLGTSQHYDTCRDPQHVFVRDNKVAVTCEDGGAMWVHDTTDPTTVREYTLGPGTRPGGVVGRDTRWWIATAGRGELYTINGNDFEGSRYGEDLRALAITSSDEVWATRWRSPEFRGEIQTASGVLELAIDPGPDSDTGNRGLPNLLDVLLFSPDGATAYVGCNTANNDRGMFRDGNPLTFESTVRATLRVVDVASGEERFESRKQFDNQGRVSAMVLAPLGNWLWVAHPGTGTLQRLDAYTLDIKGSILGAGNAVTGLAISADGSTLYAHAWLDRELRAFDISNPSRPPELLWSAPTVASEPLAPSVLQGKILFHSSSDTRMSRHGYLTCATCHPGARDDGRTWDFTDRGEGLRNTITLRGRGGLDMGRLHWSGNFDEVQDFEGDIRHGQGGTGLLSDATFDNDQTASPLGDPKAGLSEPLDALAAYVHSLTELPVSPYTSLGNGSEIFTARGCDSCHQPDTNYTDSNLTTPLRHDVRTWSEGSGERLGVPFRDFDTPTLRGVWATPPYLHDGSAPSIEDAIGRHETAGAASLTPQEKVTLAAWIRTL